MYTCVHCVLAMYIKSPASLHNSLTVLLEYINLLNEVLKNLDILLVLPDICLQNISKMLE